MNELYDDYEQGEVVKKWLTENAGAMVLGVGLGLGGLFGFQFWQKHVAEQRLVAAEALATLVADESVASNADLDTFLEHVDSTAHATLAALHLAAQAMTQGQPGEAIALLQRVVDKGEPKAVRSIAALRLARLQLDQGDHAAAEALLTPLRDGAFGGLAAAVHGDLLLAKGDLGGARQAYQDALARPNSGDRGLLQMKLDDLPPAAEES